MDYLEKYQLWLSSPYIDDDTKTELKEIKNSISIKYFRKSKNIM